MCGLGDNGSQTCTGCKGASCVPDVIHLMCQNIAFTDLTHRYWYKHYKDMYIHVTYMYVRIPLFSAVLLHFSAKLTIFFRKPECAHFGRFISRFGVYNSAVEGAMTRPVHVRFLGGSKIFYTAYHVTATDMPSIQYQFKRRLFSQRP